MSYADSFEKAKKEHGVGGGTKFKPADGDNRIRLVSPAVYHESDYQGRTTRKFVAWIIDRKDSLCKLYFMPVTVMEMIAVLQQSEDFGFTEEIPPYDHMLQVKGAGTMDVDYKVLPTKKVGPLTEAEQSMVNKLKPIGQVVESLGKKDNSAEDRVEEPRTDTTKPEADEISADDIPF